MDSHTEELLEAVLDYQKNPKPIEDAPKSLIEHYGYCSLAFCLLYKRPKIPEFDTDGKIAAYIQGHEFQTLEELIAYAKSQPSPVDKLFAIWAWAAWNVKYDVDALRNIGPSTPHNMHAVFEEKKGVCAHYAMFVVDAAKAAGVEDYGIILQEYGNGAKGFGYKPSDTEVDLKGHAAVYVEINGEKLFSEPTWGAGAIDEDYKYHRSFNLALFLMPIYDSLCDHMPSSTSAKLCPVKITGQDFLRCPRVHQYWTGPRQLKLESHPLYFITCKDGYLEQQFSCIGPVKSLSPQFLIMDDGIDSKGDEIPIAPIASWKVVENGIEGHPDRVRFKMWCQFRRAGCYKIRWFIDTKPFVSYFVTVEQKCSQCRAFGISSSTPGIVTPVSPKGSILNVVNGIGTISYRTDKLYAREIVKICKCVDDVFFKRDVEIDRNLCVTKRQNVSVGFDSSQVERQLTINFPDDGPYEVQIWLPEDERNVFHPEFSYFVVVSGAKRGNAVHPVEVMAQNKHTSPVDLPEGIEIIPNESVIMDHSMVRCLEINDPDVASEGCEKQPTVALYCGDGQEWIWATRYDMCNGHKIYYWTFPHEGEWTLNYKRDSGVLFSQLYVIKKHAHCTSVRAANLNPDLDNGRPETKACNTRVPRAAPKKATIKRPETSRAKRLPALDHGTRRIRVVKPLTKCSILEKCTLTLDHPGKITPILPRHHIVDVFNGIGIIYYRVTKEKAKEMLKIFRCLDGLNFTYGAEIPADQIALRQSVIVPSDENLYERQIALTFPQNGIYAVELHSNVRGNSFSHEVNYYFRVRGVVPGPIVHPIQFMLSNRQVIPLELDFGAKISPKESVILCKGLDARVELSDLDDACTISVNINPIPKDGERCIFPKQSVVDNVRTYEWTFRHEGLWAFQCWKDNAWFFEQRYVVEDVNRSANANSKRKLMPFASTTKPMDLGMIINSVRNGPLASQDNDEESKKSSSEEEQSETKTANSDNVDEQASEHESSDAKSENSSGHEPDDKGENKSILALPADDDEKADNDDGTDTASTASEQQSSSEHHSDTKSENSTISDEIDQQDSAEQSDTENNEEDKQPEIVEAVSEESSQSGSMSARDGDSCPASDETDQQNQDSVEQSDTKSSEEEKQPEIVVVVSEEGSRSGSITARDDDSCPTSDEVLKPDSAEQPESTTTADEQSDILLDEQKETRTQPRVSFRHQATQADLIDSKQSKCCILI